MKSYSKTVKKIFFEKDSQAKEYYYKVRNELKADPNISRKPGVQTFFFQVKDGLTYKFIVSRSFNKVNIVWIDPFETGRVYNKYITFQELFERSDPEVKKRLAYHLNIFA